MYKNIIFDLGGVMVEWKPRDYLMERFSRLSVEEKVYDITFGSKVWAELDAGLLTRYEGNQRMLAAAKEAGCVFEVQEVIDDWMTMLKPRRRMFDLAAKLKRRGYNVYYLSNISADTLQMLEERDFHGLFLGGVASCEVHVNKPNPLIYKALLERYDLVPQECIFIDDNEMNTQAAYTLGITAIHMHGSASALQRTLASMGVSVKPTAEPKA